MLNPEKRLYEFGEFTFDPAERILRENGNQILLSPKVSETLVALIEEAGRTIAYEDLIKRVWADTFASKNNLDQNIFQLRKLLGDSSSEPRYINTVPRLGYQFLSTVREVPAQLPIEVAEAATEDPEPYQPLPIAIVKVESESRNVPRLNSKTKVWMFALLLLIAVGPIVFVVYKLSTRLWRVRAGESQRTWKLPALGNVESAALSPSGDLAAYVTKSGEKSEMWIADSDEGSRHLGTADRAGLSNLVFSGDGGRIYYTRVTEGDASLCAVSIDGGTATKILADVAGRISLSPDGKQFAFVRYYVSEGETALFVANSDGTQERRIATHKEPTQFLPLNGPAWSPDGKLIVVVEEGSSTNFSTLTAFDVASGTERKISTLSEWPRFRDVAWLPDGSGLVLIVTEGGPTASTQIWRLSYPGLQSKKIADGPEVYESLSLATTSNRMLVVGRQSTSDIWVVDGDNVEPRRITDQDGAGRAGICWMPDGRIVYQSRESGVDGFWMMDINGSRKLLTEGSPGNFYPSVTADGRHLIFMSRRTGVLHVWRMDLESRALTQLTNGSEEQWPQVSADGKWVYYNSWDSGAASVWKVSVNGGQPLQVISESSYQPKPSPDGELVAYANIIDAPGVSRRKVGSVEGGPAKYSFSGPLVRLGPVYWSRDGRSLLYTDQRAGAWNIHSQPLEGGEPKQLTHFTDRQIYFFDQSWDGKKLAVARGTVSRTLQLFSGYN